jgi:hypothetical protein
MKNRKLQTKIFYDIGPWGQCYKTVSVLDLHIFVLSKRVCRTRSEKLTHDKHSSLVQKSVNQGQKQFCHIGPWGQCYKTFFVCELQIFVLS